MKALPQCFHSQHTSSLVGNDAQYEWQNRCAGASLRQFVSSRKDLDLWKRKLYKLQPLILSGGLTQWMHRHLVASGEDLST